ncbi:MAG: GIY-YIG nuclease family protein [Phycisphaeraceae bacterium]|nr:GIY-YIG nuclease family protein [Phycisphaeraceae bacterium]
MQFIEQRAQYEREYAAFKNVSLGVGEFSAENAILKRDLRNLETTIRKTRLDHKALEERQAVLDERANELASRYLADVEKAVGAAINANNYASCKQRLVRAIEWCRGIGFDVPQAKEDALLAALKADYELAVRAALEREEQARIRAQIREEQAREREIQKELQALDRERTAIQTALARAMADAESAHTDEIVSLKARLADAEARSARTVSQAQLTRSGHIYIISNIGAFGEGVYKIGMTRRLEPKDRIAELGDASVPFPFDIHMMISCSDAPALENLLHRHFHRARINRVNPRKEFFRISLEDIREFVHANHGEVKYIADAEALEYRQSQNISPEDQDYIEDVFDQAERAIGPVEVED